MEIDTKMISEILEEKSLNLNFLKKENIPLTIFAELISIYHHCISINETLDIFVERNSHSFSMEEKLILRNAAILILETYEKAKKENNLDVICEFSKIFVDSYENKHLMDNFNYESFAFDNYENVICVDLASGPEFINFISLLSETNIYELVDPSPFVCQCLQHKCNKEKISYVYPREMSALEYINKTKHSKIDCVRAKNVFKYDQNFHNIALKYFTQLKHSGAIIFQEFSYQNLFKDLINIPEIIIMCQNLIVNGATIKFSKGNSNNPLAFDSLIVRNGKMDFEELEILKETICI